MLATWLCKNRIMQVQLLVHHELAAQSCQAAIPCMYVQGQQLCLAHTVSQTKPVPVASVLWPFNQYASLQTLYTALV